MTPLPQRQNESVPGVPQALEMAKTNADARVCAAAVSLKLTENALQPLTSLSAFGTARKHKSGRTGLMSCNLLPTAIPSPKAPKGIKKPPGLAMKGARMTE